VRKLEKDYLIDSLTHEDEAKLQAALSAAKQIGSHRHERRCENVNPNEGGM
jgi:hypothetical protein